MKKLSHQAIERELIDITQQFLTESLEPYKREIKLNDSLNKHLGIDSLGRAELFKRIEKKFDVRISDRLLAEAETLNDIVEYLEKSDVNVEKIISPEKVIIHEKIKRPDVGQAKSLIDVLLLYGEKSSKKPHIYFQNEEGKEEILTYGEVLNNALRLAQGLKERGLQEGETVAIMQPTHPHFFYSFLGTLLAGGIPVPIYPPFRAHLVESYAKTEAKILSNAEVRILITFSQAETVSRLLQAFVPSLKEVTTPEVLLKHDVLHHPFKASSDHFAFIQYTSGSTSDPKGVLLSHANLLANIRTYGEAVRISEDDVAVSWLPLYHDFGLIGMWLGSLYHGIPLVLLTPFSFLNRPERWLWAIHYHRGTLSGAPNFAYELCIRKIDPAVIEGLDLSSWRLAANGAEKIYPHTLIEFAKKFEPYGLSRKTLLPVYGLAESTVGLTVPPLDREFLIDQIDRKAFETHQKAVPSEDKNALQFVSCGKPLKEHDIRVVDDEGKVLDEREVGHLQFCGPSSMQGYYHNPQATHAVYHDGWIDTGDLAYIADEELYITGRTKDLIIKAGRNLYPAEIEALIEKIPSVRKGCSVAFGVTDTVRGTEQLIVVAETKEKNQAKRSKIVDEIKSLMSESLDIVPDHVVLTTPRTVPKTSSGKLQRSACKKMYLDGQLFGKKLPASLQIAKLGFSVMMQKIKAIVSITAKSVYLIYLSAWFILFFLPVYFFVLLASPQWARTICVFWVKCLRILAFCPLKIIYPENFTKTSPVIFVANHASYMDALLVLEVLPKNTRFVGKKELFSTPIIRTFVKKLKCLPVDRMDISQGVQETDQIKKALKAGDSVLIFPEGTFGYASGLRPFRLGAFKIAVDANCSIVPFAIKGTRAVLRSGEFLFKPHSITVTACEPIKAKGSEWQDVTALRQEARAEISKYCGEPSLDYIAAQKIAPHAREQ
ncbi:MAG: hypothetical protein A3F12_07010 [Gammaproteobacteria bacterium RIFCSPHIGHO2_12_FULL_38_14]|nr:MAG: hypothetical protein A3F12_07010 [Gammaproteobacteria bacterium RIFCSPHIGHO2_12_FULL_38_14]